MKETLLSISLCISIIFADAQCIDPTIPAIGAGSNPICAGDTTILSILSGNLNDATHWQWYEDSCGGNPVGSGTALTINPVFTTVYFVRGEGGCITPGNCGSYTVTVNKIPSAKINIIGSSAICQGDSVMLAATGGGNYVWSTGATTTTIYVSTQGTYTLTATNGCGSTTDQITVSVIKLPSTTIYANGSLTFCEGDSVTLFVTGPDKYQWSTGATTNSIVVSVSGTYIVTATNSCGTSTDSLFVTVEPPPVASISANGPTTICLGDSIMLTAFGGSSFLWSTGSSLSSISVSVSGIYTVTATNACGSSAASININILPEVSISANGSTSICNGDSLLLTAIGGTSYVWSTGETTPSIYVSEAATYTVTAAGACDPANASALVTVSITPPVSITANGSTSICDGDSLLLTAIGGTSYLWSTGETTTSIYVSEAATYTVTAAGACDPANASALVTVSITPPVSITANGSTSICDGDSLLLTAIGGTSYLWSTGETTTSIYVSEAATYTVTAAGACDPANASASVTVSITPPVSITANGSTSICDGDSLLLTAIGGTSYAWSTGETTTSIYVSEAGTYTVTAAGACDPANASASVTVSITPPVSITANGSTSICDGDSLLLTAIGGTSYLWSTGETTTSIYVSEAGTYTVTAAGACDPANASASVTVSITPPVSITANGSTSICDGDSLLLTAIGGTSYLWSTGETTTSIYVSEAGTYTLSGNNSCGSSSASVTISVDEIIILSIIGDYTFCQGSSAILIASGSSSYQWSTGETTASISVTASGTYTVTAANACGISSASHTITTDTVATVSILPGGPTIFCIGDSVMLIASSGTTFQWSTGDTTAFIIVNTTGTYTVVTTSPCGTASASQVVTIDNPVTASISGDSSFCTGASTTLTASGGTSYVWSTGETTASINVNASGTYTATVTNACGSSNASQVVTADTSLIITLSPSGPTTFCTGDSVILTATGGSTYVWSTGDTSDLIAVNSSGTYTVTSSNACGSASASQTVLAVNLPAGGINGATSFCQGDSAVLTGTGGASYVWSTGETTTFIVITAQGSYTVSVSNSCGTSTASHTVTLDSLPVAAINLSGPAIFCTGDSAILTASGGNFYQWSNGSTSASVTVTTSGPITVTVSNACGQSTKTQNITVLNQVQITATGLTTFCKGDSVTLVASGGGPYFWSTEETTDSITVDTAGTYTATGTTTCPGSIDSISITIETIPDITASGPHTICKNDSVQLTASGGTNYLWNTQDTIAQIWVSTAGTYIASSTNNCGTGYDTLIITSDNLNISFLVSDTFGIAPYTVIFNNQSTTSSPPVTYNWNFGDNSAVSLEINPHHTYQDTGTFLVLLTGTDLAGCSDVDSVIIKIGDDKCYTTPDVFTPNGDNLNDYFNFHGICILSISGTIYNRWGENIATWKTLDKGWDGNNRNGRRASAGVYFYIIDLKLTDNQEYNKTGVVNLIR